MAWRKTELAGLQSTVFSFLSQLSSSSSESTRTLSAESIRCLDFLFQGDPVLERAFEHVDRDEVARLTTPVPGRVFYAVASSSIFKVAKARSSSHSHHVTIASLCSSNAPIASILAYSHIVTLSSVRNGSSSVGSCSCFSFTNSALMGRPDLEDQDQVSNEFSSTLERVPPLTSDSTSIDLGKGEEENEKEERGQEADTTVSPTSIKSTPHFGLCKHILAAFIAEAVGRYSTRILTAEDMKQIFM